MQFKTMICAGWGILLATSLAAQQSFPLHAAARQQLSRRAPATLAKLNTICMPAAENKATGRGGAQQLDSTVLFTNFLLNDSFPQSKSVFNYPSSQLSVVTEYDNVGGWQPGARSAQKTDGLGRTIEVLGEIIDPNAPGVWIPESRLLSAPHGNSKTLTDSFSLATWDPATAKWTTVISSSTSFDDQDRPAAIFTHFADLFGQEISLMDELYYDANGDNHLTIESILEQGEWLPFTRIETAYAQHRDTASISYAIIDDETFVPQNKSETEYTPTGQIGIIRNYAWDFAADGWTLEQNIGYLYDNDDRVTSLVTDIPDPTDPQRSWTQSVYTDDGPLHVEINYSWDFGTGAWVLIDKTYHYYSGTTANHELPDAGALPLSPNPTTGLVRLPAAENARMLVLNAQGAAVQPARTRLSDGEIDLSNLPAGLYFISVDAGNRRQTGAVVKQ